MKPKSLAETIFDLSVAIENCLQNNNKEWYAKHRAKLAALSQFLPSGSGIDNGTTIEEVSTTPERITLACGYHHMNEHGSYDGWTEHKIYVSPSFNGLNLRITGRDRNAIKDYLHEVFYTCLKQEVMWDQERGLWVADSEFGDLTAKPNRAVPEAS